MIMLGVERFDRELSDVWSLCGGLVLEGSVHGFLAENRQRVFPDEMFADLFSSGRGRPSVPGMGGGDGDGVAVLGGFVGSGSDREVAV